MIGGLYPAASALKAYSTVMNVTAHNIANVNSRGYISKAATLAEMKTGGVEVTALRDNMAPPHLSTYFTNSESYIAERMSNVAIETERINEITSLRAFQGNAGVLHTSDDMIGTLINMTV